MKLKRALILSIPILIIAIGLFWLTSYLGLLSDPTPTTNPNTTTIQQTSTPNSDSNNQPVDYEIEPIAQGLSVPWDIEFTSDNRILVTQRPGTIRVIENGQLQTQPLITIEEVSPNAEAGLMGMTKHPQYDSNKLIYVCYAYSTNNQLRDKVITLTDNGTTATLDKTIIEDIPAARFHAGCRLDFGPDGKLYITTGDATNGNLAQDLDSLAGKILRLNSDGSIPTDNPFANSPVYSYGHRNSQGIAWHPITQDLWSTEHGPSGNDGPLGGDEVNLIQLGQNYGWPEVSHQRSRAGMIDPKLVFTPAEAPASALIYSGSVFPQFTNNLFFGALRGEGIVRIVLDPNNPTTITDFEKLDLGLGRIRDIVEGPDGLIYFTTSNTDGRGDTQPGDDHLYRFVPQP